MSVAKWQFDVQTTSDGKFYSLMVDWEDEWQRVDLINNRRRRLFPVVKNGKCGEFSNMCQALGILLLTVTASPRVYWHSGRDELLCNVAYLCLGM